jgi:hypothetical protein
MVNPIGPSSPLISAGAQSSCCAMLKTLLVPHQDCIGVDVIADRGGP